MGFNICSIQEKRLVDHLHSLKVKGEIIEKKTLKPSEDQSEINFLIVKFKDRKIEKQVDDLEFEQTNIGEHLWFTPPVPERDPCNCNFFVWLIAGVVAGGLAIWAITNHFHGRTAVFFSLAAGGWASVIAWAMICSHEQKKRFRDLVRELHFFETEAGK